MIKTDGWIFTFQHFKFFILQIFVYNWLQQITAAATTSTTAS